MEEIWKPVAGYEENYFVSNHGRIKSRFSDRERILIPHKGKYGHCRIQLYNEGSRIRSLVHRLVAFAFLPDAVQPSEVNHIDFDPTNNRVENLEWVTHQQNIMHSRHRLSNIKGESHVHAKLSEQDVLSMRATYAAGGTSFAKLAKQFGICTQQCHRIVRGERWQHTFPK